MPNRSKKNKNAQSTLQDFVAVVFAEDLNQAKQYQTLLANNDIPAVIKKGTSQSLSAKDIAVMVPEDYLDEAHVIIESQDVYDDFCDYVFEDSGEQLMDELDDDFDERGF